MGKFLESHWNEQIIPNPNAMRDFLREEIDKGEPLETVQAFCQRNFGSGKRLPSMLGHKSKENRTPINGNETVGVESHVEENEENVMLEKFESDEEISV